MIKIEVNNKMFKKLFETDYNKFMNDKAVDEMTVEYEDTGEVYLRIKK